jgi:predicted PurR-regulated permease PerM
MMTDHEFTHRMVRTVLTVAAVAIVLATLWAAREAVMLIYISALIAMGFAPLVRLLERPRSGGRQLVPRWVAILCIYAGIIGVLVLIGLAVVPPLVAQAETLWAALPGEFLRFQNFLIRHRLMTHRVSLEEAVQNAPSGSGGNAVGTVFGALFGLIGGVFGIITVLILSFYFLVEAQSLFEYVIRFVPDTRRAAVSAAARRAVIKVSAWLRANLILGAVMGTAAAIGMGYFGEPFYYVVALVAAIG